MNRGKTVSVPGAPSPEQPRLPVGALREFPRAATGNLRGAGDER
jgi:hypothetical protein